jgi:hypothetical protein
MAVIVLQSRTIGQEDKRTRGQEEVERMRGGREDEKAERMTGGQEEDKKRIG